MWVVISALLFGGFAIRAIEPIESESPKIRSARVSIRGRGWTPALGCCIVRSQDIVAIWSFEGQLSGLGVSAFLDRPLRIPSKSPVRYHGAGIVLMRDCLRLRNRREVTRIITPTCRIDPAMKVSDARVGPASARE